MTANQVAYAGVTESERHNTAVEVETNRHNLKMEELEDRRVGIQELAAQAQANYWAETTRINDQIGNLKLQIEKSQGDERLRLQEQMNSLQAERNQLEADYKRKENEVRTEANAINREMGEANILHQTTLETIERYRAETERELRNKSLEYQKYQWDTENQLKGYQILNSQNQTIIDLAKLQQQMYEFEKKYPLEETKIITNGIRDVLGAVRDTAQAVSQTFKLGG